MIFEIDQVDALVRHVSEQSRAAVHRGVLSAGMRLVRDIKGVLISREDPPPIDQKTYANAWQCVETPEGAGTPLGRRHESWSLASSDPEAVAENT